MEFIVEGLEECLSKLEALPERIVKNHFGKALLAAGSEIFNAVQPRVPVDTGKLADALKTTISVDAEGKGGMVEIGFTGAQAGIARLVEMGHREVSHRPNLKDSGKVVQPHPFLRPAAATSKDSAVQAFEESLSASLADDNA
jgi:HK97 gp10 family phage protein